MELPVPIQPFFKYLSSNFEVRFLFSHGKDERAGIWIFDHLHVAERTKKFKNHLHLEGGKASPPWFLGGSGTKKGAAGTRCRVSAVASVALPSPHEALELQRSGKSYVFYCLRDVCWRLVVGCCCLILLVVRCRMLDIVGGWMWLVVVGWFFGWFFGSLRWEFPKSVQKFEISSLFFSLRYTVIQKLAFLSTNFILSTGTATPKKIGLKMAEILWIARMPARNELEPTSTIIQFWTNLFGHLCCARSI